MYKQNCMLMLHVTASTEYGIRVDGLLQEDLDFVILTPVETTFETREFIRHIKTPVIQFSAMAYEVARSVAKKKKMQVFSVTPSTALVEGTDMYQYFNCVLG